MVLIKTLLLQKWIAVSGRYGHYGTLRECPSKYHEMKILLPVTSAKIWPESGMLTVNISITGGTVRHIAYGLMMYSIIKILGECIDEYELSST